MFFDTGHVPEQVEIQDAGAARCRARQTGQHADGGGLARPVGTEEAEHLALADGEVHPIHGAQGRAVFARRVDFGQASGPDDIVHEQYPFRISGMKSASGFRQAARTKYSCPKNNRCRSSGALIIGVAARWVA